MAKKKIGKDEKKKFLIVRHVEDGADAYDEEFWYDTLEDCYNDAEPYDKIFVGDLEFLGEVERIKNVVIFKNENKNDL